MTTPPCNHRTHMVRYGLHKHPDNDRGGESSQELLRLQSGDTTRCGQYSQSCLSVTVGLAVGLAAEQKNASFLPAIQPTMPSVRYSKIIYLLPMGSANSYLRQVQVKRPAPGLA